MTKLGIDTPSTSKISSGSTSEQTSNQDANLRPTDYLRISYNTQGSSDLAGQPPTKKRKHSTLKQKELLNLACTYLSRKNLEPQWTVDDDKFSLLAKSWTQKLRNLDSSQLKYVEKFVNEILFEADLGTLDRDSVKINRKRGTSLPSEPISPTITTPADMISLLQSTDPLATTHETHSPTQIPPLRPITPTSTQIPPLRPLTPTKIPPLRPFTPISTQIPSSIETFTFTSSQDPLSIQTHTFTSAQVASSTPPHTFTTQILTNTVSDTAHQIPPKSPEVNVSNQKDQALLTCTKVKLEQTAGEEEEDRLLLLVKDWTNKLRILDPLQMKYAELFIKEILFEADLGMLDRDSLVINGRIR
uniref:Uncharacterized protein n=1 Tax=Clastoptera arizonana TaxID=38151 RepID=A0A1B6CJ03_9HEMI